MATATLPVPGYRFVIPQGHTTNHAKELRSRVEAALADGGRHLVIDGEAWSQLDVSMLSSLIQCASVCRTYGASFEITNVSREMKARVRALSLNERIGLPD